MHRNGARGCRKGSELILKAADVDAGSSPAVRKSGTGVMVAPLFREQIVGVRFSGP